MSQASALPLNKNTQTKVVLSPLFESDHHDDGRLTSFFEFWPGWVMYLPVAMQWIVLSLYHRSVTLPFLANPSLNLAGMVGVPKSELMQQATGLARDYILPWVACKVDGRSADIQADEFLKTAADNNIHMPFACKPDIGCRGIGVKLVKTIDQLKDIIHIYPVDAVLLCQKLASWEPEVGVFYVKDPKTGQGKIESLTYKYLPVVVGDGTSTLCELIHSDKRAGLMERLYYTRHQDEWNRVLDNGEVMKLVFSASHSKGATFHDIRDQITDELTHKVHQIMSDIPNFYYGRLDVKFRDADSLRKGETLEIVEINGASAESIHIWDKNARFSEAMRALLWQYRTLFSLGAYHRKQGKRPPKLSTFIKKWRIEKNLTRHYPLTD